MNSTPNAPRPAKLTPILGLKDRNTFGLDASAQLAYEIDSGAYYARVLDPRTYGAIT